MTTTEGQEAITQDDAAKIRELADTWAQGDANITALLDAGMDAGDAFDAHMETGRKLLEYLPRLLKAAYGKKAGADA